MCGVFPDECLNCRLLLKGIRIGDTCISLDYIIYQVSFVSSHVFRLKYTKKTSKQKERIGRN